MKVEMTEREAREKLAAVLAVHVVPNREWEEIKVAWGLEFAPEPPLPERFYFREPDGHDNKQGWATDGPDGGLILFEVSAGGRWRHREQYRIDATRRACEWANAYPDLRRAAGMLAEQILRGGDPIIIMSLARDLRSVLDKGPKP